MNVICHIWQSFQKQVEKSSPEKIPGNDLLLSHCRMTYKLVKVNTIVSIQSILQYFIQCMARVLPAHKIVGWRKCHRESQMRNSGSNKVCFHTNDIALFYCGIERKKKCLQCKPLQSIEVPPWCMETFQSSHWPVFPLSKGPGCYYHSSIRL